MKLYRRLNQLRLQTAYLSGKSPIKISQIGKVEVKGSGVPEYAL